MLKLLSLCLFDDQMLPMVSDHGCVSEGGTEKHQNCVSHFQNLVEAQWNAVKNKYTVAWHPELNLQQPDIARYSNDSLINALAMGQLVAFFNASAKDVPSASCWTFSFMRYSTELLYLILYISTHHVEATSVSWMQGCRDRIRSLYPSYLKELVC